MAAENTQPFSAKPTVAFGNAPISEKPSVSSFGSGLFNNVGNASFGTNNAQSSALFGSNTPTPIPFGSQTSNTISIQKKSDPTKPEKSSSVFEVNAVQKPATATKTVDKENAHKIEVPKPVIGGIAHDKIDTVQKPTAIQPTLSNFGITSSGTVNSNSIPPVLSFGTTAPKDSSAAFNTISSGQSNEAAKSSFSIPLVTAPTKPNNEPVSAVVSSSSSNDFSFSLDKMGITPKGRFQLGENVVKINNSNAVSAPTATVNAFQKPLFNLDPKNENAVVSKVTSSDDTEKLLENLSVCKPTSTNNDKASES